MLRLHLVCVIVSHFLVDKSLSLVALIGLVQGEGPGIVLMDYTIAQVG